MTRLFSQCFTRCGLNPSHSGRGLQTLLPSTDIFRTNGLFVVHFIWIAKGKMRYDADSKPGKCGLAQISGLIQDGRISGSLPDRVIIPAVLYPIWISADWDLTFASHPYSSFQTHTFDFSGHRFTFPNTDICFSAEISILIFLPSKAKGCPPLPNLQFFLNIVQKAFDPPPPLRFEHYDANFLMDFLRSA